MKHLLIPALLGLSAVQVHASIIAAYNFDETSGTTAVDSVRGVTGDATLAGGASFSTGQIGNALTLDGSTGWASALNPIVANQAQLSVSAWVNFNVLSGWATIAKDWDAAATFHFGLDNSTGKFSNYIGGSGAGPVVGSTVATTNTWYHVAFTFDDASNTQNIYVNGALVGTASATTGSLANGGGGNMGIGNTNIGSSQYLNGRIDDLMFYNNVLSQGDVTALYNNGLAGISAVPEPATYGLLGAGILAGSSMIRRRRKFL